MDGPVAVLKAMMDAFQTMMASKDVTIGRVALKHRKQQRFHIVYPDCSDKIVGLEVRKQDLKVLSRDFPGID